jgi:hypothetical protein
MEAVISVLFVILFCVLVLSLLVYAVLLAVVYLKRRSTDESTQTKELRDAINKNARLSIGVPTAAVSAAMLVTTLLQIFPPSEEGELIKLEFFNLTFSGPAGPITLWVVCFLSFVAAIKLLSRR